MGRTIAGTSALLPVFSDEMLAVGEFGATSSFTGYASVRATHVPTPGFGSPSRPVTGTGTHVHVSHGGH